MNLPSIVTDGQSEDAIEVFLDYGDSVAKVTYTGSATPLEETPGATFITAAEYAERAAEIRGVNESAWADAKAADASNTRADYEALRALKVPELTARRLTGYKGD